MSLSTGGVAAWLDTNEPKPPVIWARDDGTDPLASVDPVASLTAIRGLLEGLGIRGAYERPKAMLARATEVERAAAVSSGAVQKRLSEAREAVAEAAAGGDLTAAFAALDEALRASDAWLPRQPGEKSRMAVEVKAVQQRLRQSAIVAATGEADAVYRRLQARAAEAVTAAAEAPLPDKVLTLAEPAKAVLRSDSPGSWATLMRAADDFDRVHEAAAWVRHLGGIQDLLPGRAPRVAWRCRAWLTAQEHDAELRRVAGPLRLRFMVENGWLPGLWRADEIDPSGDPPAEKRRRGVLAALVERNPNHG